MRSSSCFYIYVFSVVYHYSVFITFYYCFYILQVFVKNVITRFLLRKQKVKYCLEPNSPPPPLRLFYPPTSPLPSITTPGLAQASPVSPGSSSTDPLTWSHSSMSTPATNDDILFSSKSKFWYSHLFFLLSNFRYHILQGEWLFWPTYCSTSTKYISYQATSKIGRLSLLQYSK